MESKLYKDSGNKIISGVCAGVADAIHLDPTIVRIIAAALCIYWPFLILIYLLLAIVLPEKTMVKYAEQAKRREGERPAGADASEPNPSASSEQPVPNQNKSAPFHSSNIIFAVILICSGIGLFITRVVFDYAIGFADFVTFITLGIGIYLIVSGLMDGKENHAQRTTKLISGSVICFFCLLWIFDLFGYSILSVNNLLSSMHYLWPLFIIAIGLNVLLPNKKASAVIWLTLILVFLIYTIMQGGLIHGMIPAIHI